MPNGSVCSLTTRWLRCCVREAVQKVWEAEDYFAHAERVTLPVKLIGMSSVIASDDANAGQAGAWWRSWQRYSQPRFGSAQLNHRAPGWAHWSGGWRNERRPDGREGVAVVAVVAVRAVFPCSDPVACNSRPTTSGGEDAAGADRRLPGERGAARPWLAQSTWQARRKSQLARRSA